MKKKILFAALLSLTVVPAYCSDIFENFSKAHLAFGNRPDMTMGEEINLSQLRYAGGARSDDKELAAAYESAILGVLNVTHGDIIDLTKLHNVEVKITLDNECYAAGLGERASFQMSTLSSATPESVYGKFYIDSGYDHVEGSLAAAFDALTPNGQRFFDTHAKRRD